VLEHSFEIYADLIASTFATLGLWLGFTITKPPQKIDTPELPISIEPRNRGARGITLRELEILNRIAQA
jgi:hypothetical protein